MSGKSHAKFKKQNTKDNRALEQAMLFVAIIEPLMTIPQIVELYSHPGQGNISVTTWVLYMAASSMWLIYGLYHRNKPLIFTGILWVVMDIMVIVGAIA